MELPLSRLDLNLLTVFDMLMQERNVTRAAERLHLSQSTVSHALGRLRQALDDPLFVMSRREMMPTERAKALARPVRQALAMLEQGLRQAKGFDPASARRIFRIATPGSVEHGLVPVLVEWMVQQAPHCRLEVCELADSDYERELEKGELDLVIGFAVPTTSRPGCGARSGSAIRWSVCRPSAALCPTCWGRENWSAAPISTLPAGATARPWWISGWPVSGWSGSWGSGCRALWRYRR